MGTLLIYIYRVLAKKRFLFLFLLLVLCMAAVFQLRKLSLEDDFNQIFPQNKEISAYNDILSNSSLLDRIVVHVFSEDSLVKPDPDYLSLVAHQFRDSVAATLMPRYVKAIQPEADNQFFEESFAYFYHHLPLFMEEADYAWLEKEVLQGDFLQQQMGRNYRNLLAPTGMAMRDYILRDPLQLVLRKTALLRDMQMDENLRLYNDFLLTKDERSLLFFIQPQDAGNASANEEFVASMEHYRKFLLKKYPDIRMDIFGSVPVSVANTRQIKKDIRLTVSLAFVLLVLLMTYFYRSKRSLILIFLPVVLGALVGLTFFSVFTPEMSAISLAIGAVILGIAVDFPLHFLTHRKHSRSSVITLRDITEPVMMSSLTTATAFLCLLFISSPALRDMGLFAAISVVATAISALLLLPLLVKESKQVKHEEETDAQKDRSKPDFVEFLASLAWHKKKNLLVGVLLATLVFMYTARFTGFDQNLEKSAYSTPELAEADQRLKMLTSITEKTVYVMAQGHNLDTCLQQNSSLMNKLHNLHEDGAILSYYSIHRLIPPLSVQRERIDRWNHFWDGERTLFKSRMEEAGRSYGFNQEAFRYCFSMIDNSYSPISPDSLQQKIEFATDDFVIRVGANQCYLANLVKVDSEESRQVVYELMQPYQQAYVFDRKFIAESLFDLLKADFNTLITYSLLLVFLILYLFFGRIELAVVTFIPMLVSWLWAVGIMGLVRIDFTIFNVVITSFIFGLGIDYAIFMTKGYLQQLKYGENTIHSYKSSILISSLTTLISLGVLLFAKHPALQSIALVSMIGIVSVLMITFTWQPLLLSAMFYKNGQKRSMPVTLSQFVYSCYAFLFFALISLTLSGLVPLFLILPVNRYRKQLWFRYLIYWACRGVILTSWVTHKEFPGINHRLFQKPSILVSNHQSVTDLLFFMGTSPHIIILTKDWVWNNFFFGQIVRFAGYINVSEGNDKVLPKIEAALNHGASILVFPEGSRTRDGRIRRFHKGAFYLAEKLGADITAILLDGYFEALPPGHFLVNNATMTMKKLIRLSPQEMTGGYSLAAKEMCRHFRQEQAALQREKLRFELFKKQLVKKYIYKGPAVEYYVRIKLWTEDYYQLHEPLIPYKARITDLGCGYGMLANMLTLTSPEREIVGIDFDERKIRVAENTVDSHQQLRFEVGDLTDYIPAHSDVFIISDVLHYLPHNLQIEVLQRCVNRLLPGGKIFIRDGNSELKKKHKGTQFTEFISTHIGFNKKRYDLSFLSFSIIADFAEKNQLSVETIDRTRLTSNQLYVLTRNLT